MRIRGSFSSISGVRAKTVSATEQALEWEAVTSGFGVSGINSVATDGDDVWIAVGSSGTMTRSVPS